MTIMVMTGTRDVFAPHRTRLDRKRWKILQWCRGHTGWKITDHHISLCLLTKEYISIIIAIVDSVRSLINHVIIMFIMTFAIIRIIIKYQSSLPECQLLPVCLGQVPWVWLSSHRFQPLRNWGSWLRPKQPSFTLNWKKKTKVLFCLMNKIS